MEEMVKKMNNILSFYKNKRVLVTGHTGFKGTWLCKILLEAGAEIAGYSLLPPTEPNIFSVSGIESQMKSTIGDIRNIDDLKEMFYDFKPEIVFHLAAQPIVRDSYSDPRYTYETNVMGTVNILECIRESDTVISFLNVTTDKVYENKEWEWGYREIEALDGFDPYSNSKSCSELVTHSYNNSFFSNRNIGISTARAGNVIGGGDFANDRIIPDCVRFTTQSEKIIVRNPFSTRPYQHVLEPLYAYIMIAQKQYEDNKFSGYYNVGPNDSDCVTTGRLVDLFCKSWGENADWINVSKDDGLHEANFLKLDCSKLKKVFDWEPKWNIEECMHRTCKWYKLYYSKGDVIKEMEYQIMEFFTNKV